MLDRLELLGVDQRDNGGGDFTYQDDKLELVNWMACIELHLGLGKDSDACFWGATGRVPQKPWMASESGTGHPCNGTGFNWIKIWIQ